MSTRSAPEPAPDARPSGTRRLRVTARAVEALIDGGLAPSGWRDPDFARSVDRIRAHLLPIRSLAALAESWSREHAVRVRPHQGGRVPPEVRVAYGVRWLEIAGRIDERPWRVLCPPAR